MSSSRLPSLDGLRVWYEFCTLVEPEQWPNGHPLRPKRGESFESWLERNEEDFELTPSHGLVEHRTPEDFESHFIEGFYEFHVSVNLYAPKAVIRREFNRLLDERQTRPGIKDAAGFRFNAPVYPKPLKKVLAVLRASRQGKSDVEIATMVLGKNYKNTNTAAAAVSRDRKKGLAILGGIPAGRFPDPTKSAGDWSRMENYKAVRHTLGK
jgi:hypothetical protein